MVIQHDDHDDEGQKRICLRECDAGEVSHALNCLDIKNPPQNYEFDYEKGYFAHKTGPMKFDHDKKVFELGEISLKEDLLLEPEFHDFTKDRCDWVLGDNLKDDSNLKPLVEAYNLEEDYIVNNQFTIPKRYLNELEAGVVYTITCNTEFFEEEEAIPFSYEFKFETPKRVFSDIKEIGDIILLEDQDRT